MTAPEDLLDARDRRAIARVVQILQEVREMTRGSGMTDEMAFQMAMQASHSVDMLRLGNDVVAAAVVLIDEPITINGLNTYEQNGPGAEWPKILKGVSQVIADAITKHAKSLGADPSSGARK